MRHLIFLMLSLFCSGHLLAQTSCINPDVNCDGAVTTNDLLGLLGYFGDFDADGDGIWDSEDECVFCVPGCGDPVSHQGYDYATVLIGNQCWFAENLRSWRFNDDAVIPAGLSDIEWSSTTSGAVAVYGEDAGCGNSSPDIDACDADQSLNEYGRLYNWQAVDDARGLCPNGWHVPTDEEWFVMMEELGGYYVAGVQMKTDYGWSDGWAGSGNGTNLSGFSGLPGGHRSPYGGSFNSAGFRGYWWSSTPNGSKAWCWFMDSDEGYLFRSDQEVHFGQSIRCIKDPE